MTTRFTKNIFLAILASRLVIVLNAQSRIDVDIEDNKVYCHFRLFIPEACMVSAIDPITKREIRASKELTVLNFYFKNGWNNRNKEWNEVNRKNREFCEFSEIPKFPIDCIKQVANFSFRDHVRCPRQDVVEIDAPALWIEDTTYRNLLFRQSYRKETTGLVLNCFSNHILQFRSSEKVQFSGVDLKMGKTTKLALANFIKANNIIISNENNDQNIRILRNNSTTRNPINWMNIQIPKSLKSGRLEGYTGNYSLYYLDREHKEVQVKKYEILIHDPVLPSQANTNNAIRLNIQRINIQCEASSNENIYLATIGVENPLETRLLQRCLPVETACVAKNVGLPCWKNRPCSNLNNNSMKMNGLVFCSHRGSNVTEEYFTGLDLVISRMDPHKVCSELLIQLRENDGEKLLTAEDEDEELDENDCKYKQNMTVYEMQHVNFECHYLPYILVPSVIWNVKYKNNSVIQIHATEVDSEDLENEQLVDVIGGIRVILNIKSAKFGLNFTTDMVEISCSASYWDSSVYVSSIINLQVLRSTPPKFEKDSRIQEPLVVEAGHDFNVTCMTMKTVPPPTYEWFFNKKKIATNENCIKIMHDLFSESSHLSVCNAGKSHEGTFTCRDINFLDSVEKMFAVQVTQEKSDAWIYFGISCGVIALLLPIIVILYRIYLRQRAKLSELEISAFINGDEKELKTNKLAHENAQFLPYNKDYEILWKDFEMEDGLLGEGAYGIVHKGKVKGRNVAAKTVRLTAEKSEVLALLSELKIMIYLGKHENIVELVGACTSMLKEGRPYIFVEFCDNGDFKSFLKKCRPYFTDELNKRSATVDQTSLYGNQTTIRHNEFTTVNCIHSYYNLSPTNSNSTKNSCGNNELVKLNTHTERYSARSSKLIAVSTSDLFRWAAGIANGMEYLESKKVIHGDLAARNVLLTSSWGIKITDFGLSRQLQRNYTQYVKKHEAALPWRWMAIESLCDLVFTSKSDVWSLGVTLWEMFSLGEVPYTGYNWTLELLEEFQNGLRLPKPHYANDAIFEIITTCWNSDPDQRPSFAQLRNAFTFYSDQFQQRQNYISTLNVVDA